jgi:hypothetical protein
VLERPEQDRVHDAEGGGVDAEAEAEREDHNREEPGMVPACPGGVASASIDLRRNGACQASE